jgi:ribosomal protein L13E
MIWSFERQDERLRCEVRRHADGQDYEFVVTRPDGTEAAEQFDDPSAMIARSVDFMRGLVEEGWRSGQDSSAAS